MTFEVEVYCECGDELTVREIGDGTLKAAPCQSCLDKKFDKDYNAAAAVDEG